MLIHLSMGKSHICVGYEGCHMVCHLVDVIDTVVYIVHLPAAP